MDSPEGIAVDSFGNVYVADYGNDRIQKFSSNGTFITKWGSEGEGDGQFIGPKGIALDSFGNVYVADPGGTTESRYFLRPTFEIPVGLCYIMDENRDILLYSQIQPCGV